MATVTITVILEPKKRKSGHCFHFFPFYLLEVMGLNAMILVFGMLSFKPVFSLSSFTLIKELFSSCSLLPFDTGPWTPRMPSTPEKAPETGLIHR